MGKKNLKFFFKAAKNIESLLFLYYFLSLFSNKCLDILKFPI